MRRLISGWTWLLLLLLAPTLRAQSDSGFSFMAAGHAYGSHDGDNTGLHPPLLKSFFTGIDSTVNFVVFTGDIVNHSTAESWQRVEYEMDSLGLPSYYVMGNHDDNEVGRSVFQEKHGGTYYAFRHYGNLFIVLNSIEADRAISDQQLSFLKEEILHAGDSTRNIFIFFHEILWNSHEKYIGVRSNSRSRYDQVVEHSNYWEEVHPMLEAHPEKNFILIAGDMGGNPDAVSAFYDRWDHITLLASGMGEVADENYLQVYVFGKDSLDFELVPLDESMILSGIEYYSVPPPPDSISGPNFVFQGSSSVTYLVPGVFNADAYIWTLPSGAKGGSSSEQIKLDFSMDFEYGELYVKAHREGFGSGAAASLDIRADYTSLDALNAPVEPLQIKLHQDNGLLYIHCKGLSGEALNLQILDINGRILDSVKVHAGVESSEIQVSTPTLPAGVLIISAFTNSRMLMKKVLVW